MNFLERKNCVITGKDDLEYLYSFHQFPVFMGCVDHSMEDDLKADMSWWISCDSGLIQLRQLMPLEILYPEAHGAGAIGEVWKKHHKAFANFLYQKSPSAVLEIGGAHGILAKEFQQLSTILWTIVEPNPFPIEGCNARFIKGFFDEKFNYKEPFDTVVHSHVFEHMYDPDQFMKHLASFMDEGQRLIFSLPNLEVWLERNYTSCINFEHTLFLTEPYVEFMLAKHGFRLEFKEYFMEDHSIFYDTVRDKTVSPKSLPKGLYKKNKKLYLSFIDYHQRLIFDLNKKIKMTNQPIYLFGAHVFSQYLLAFGLDTSHIISLLDNDPQKQDKRLYGTHLMVQSPDVLKNIENPIVILKAGAYNQEIKEDILQRINKFVTFFE